MTRDNSPSIVVVNTEYIGQGRMLNISDPERGLALSYAPREARAALAALFALDDALAALLASTREPALGQIRLAWWRERLEALDHAPPPAEPVLTGLAAEVLPKGVTGARLAGLVEGWEVLILADALDDAALVRFAEGRGGTLFALAGAALGAGAGDRVIQAGQGWALADLARHLAAPDEAARAVALAVPLLAEALAPRWSREGRALGALAHLAQLDLALPAGAPRPVGAPRRVGRLLWHRLTGR